MLTEMHISGRSFKPFVADTKDYTTTLDYSRYPYCSALSVYGATEA